METGRTDNYANARIPDAIWTIKDIAIVTLSIFAGAIMLYLITLALFGDNQTTFRLARYVGSFLMITIPLFWVRKKYGLSKEVLGLRKGNLNLASHALIGVAAAIIYSSLAQLPIFRYGAAPVGLNIAYSPIDLILVPLSLGGFAATVLTPVSEEIMMRGFVYGYLRRRMGIAVGIIIQALFFSFMHVNTFETAFTVIAHTFIIGAILGILYERTGSLYPSMICHGTINYLSIIIFALRR
jgi:membrane protease YdiL (CAAX protease family)